MAKRLSPRLSQVASFVPKGCHPADIGSDHAQLPIFLVESGKVDFAVATDVNMGPYLGMKSNVNASKAANRIRCYRFDGISELPDGVDTLTICGLGGLKICSILEAHPEKLGNIQTIILDPHRDLMAVRKRVCELGFHIEDEAMVVDDPIEGEPRLSRGRIYYAIIKFTRGFPPLAYTPNELAFGPVLMRRADPLYLEWLQTQKGKTSKLLNSPNLSAEKRQELLKIYRAISGELARKAKPGEGK